MELRRISLYLVLFAMAVCLQCSDAHTMRRRGTDDADYDDALMGDEATDDETQNDADGGNEAEEEDTPPETIVTLPTSYNVTVGRTIRLECKVSPNNGPVIEWHKNGHRLFMGGVKYPDLEKIENSERLTVTNTSHDLFIADVRASDSGTYRCQVMQFEPVMIEHQVSVQEAPRIIRFTASDDGTVVEGSDLLLTCDVAGSPPPQIIWSRENSAGNVRLQESDAVFTLNTAFIKNIHRDQAGKYYCYVFNGLGNTQAERTVKVLHKPHVQVHKTVVNSALGVEAILQCSTHGEPEPAITWYKDGFIIDGASTQFVITREGLHSNLTVTPKEDQDFGTFTCEARNSHGKHNKSIELVQRPVVEGVELEGNKLSWRVHSHQPLQQLELQLRDTEGTVTTVNVPVPETKGHEYEVIYVLDNVNPGKYEVVVKAKNNKDWSRESEPIVVDYEAMPMPIQTASVYHGNAHSIRPASSVVLSTVFMYLLVRMF
ncbi:hypothetical protein ABMA28_010474 [Loxostege sticticalis]|uniref:Ig-like domain-containing protein n=1 Tax=Loxostege sticticalis TaxID=481309 RepID=A0ABD0S8X2_LOXSC